MKYSVGQKVKVREWDDMVAEFGLDEEGDISCDRCFVSTMRDLCGRTATVTDVRQDGLIRLDAKDDLDWTWIFSKDMIIPA